VWGPGSGKSKQPLCSFWKEKTLNGGCTITGLTVMLSLRLNLENALVAPGGRIRENRAHGGKAFVDGQKKQNRIEEKERGKSGVVSQAKPLVIKAGQDPVKNALGQGGTEMSTTGEEGRLVEHRTITCVRSRWGILRLTENLRLNDFMKCAREEWVASRGERAHGNKGLTICWGGRPSAAQWMNKKRKICRKINIGIVITVVRNFKKPENVRD